MSRDTWYAPVRLIRASEKSARYFEFGSSRPPPGTSFIPDHMVPESWSEAEERCAGGVTRPACRAVGPCCSLVPPDPEETAAARRPRPLKSSIHFSAIPLGPRNDPRVWAVLSMRYPNFDCRSKRAFGPWYPNCIMKAGIPLRTIYRLPLLSWRLLPLCSAALVLAIKPAPLEGSPLRGYQRRVRTKETVGQAA